MAPASLLSKASVLSTAAFQLQYWQCCVGQHRPYSDEVLQFAKAANAEKEQGLVPTYINITHFHDEAGEHLWKVWEAEMYKAVGLVESPRRFEMQLVEAIGFGVWAKGSLWKAGRSRFEELADETWKTVEAESHVNYEKEKLRCGRHATLGLREPDDPPVHIALIASVGQPPFGPKMMATVRSALFFSKRRFLQFHLIVDEAGEASVKQALEDLEPWLRQKGRYNLIASKSLQHVWEKINELLPKECRAATKRYGAVGWLRMFPHEVFRDEQYKGIGNLIWVDAGDYVFLNDPFLAAAPHFSPGQVAASPFSNTLEFQVFNLKKMRAYRKNWTEVLERTVRQGIEEKGVEDFCGLGEGTAMGLLSRSESTSYLWGGNVYVTLLSDWAMVPYMPWIVRDGLMDVWDRPKLGFFASTPWDRPPTMTFLKRLYPGLVDFMTLRQYCGTFHEALMYRVVDPTASGAVVAAIDDLAETSSEAERPANIHGQLFRCGLRASGVHFPSGFHHVPWVHRFLNYRGKDGAMSSRGEVAKRRTRTSFIIF
eukprot:TRINITY_DN1094_c0_g2_i3.p1 TRINITY_DN1094_c0_g2~~TRINITY_DN1094_c0_g2_i3.p1  ORF type:complete len:611 (+),score=98.11 TRINITY_DN1094_c0_g2_i3:214-1833(+)